MKFCTTIAIVAALLTAAIGHSTAQAQLYWDINGTSAGATDDVSGFGDGDWGTGVAASNWNTVADGTGTTTTWTDGNAAIFSAGTNALDSLIAVSGTVAPSSLEIQEGKVSFSGASPSLNLGANPVRVDENATLQISNVLQLGFADNQVTTLDGGTLSNKIVGAGSTFWGYVTLNPTTIHPSRIELTSKGGTVNVPNSGGTDLINGAYSIVQYANNASVIGMTSGTTAATLHKTGHGEFRASNSWTFTTLDVQSGLYRILSPTNNGADTGFGDVNGTVMIAGGAVENTTNGAGVGTTANLTSDAGAAGPSPATRSFVLTGVGGPDSMFVLNSNWQILGPISGPGGLMLNGWERNDAGAFIGAANELRLGGTNTYGGATTINFGTIVAQNGSAIPNTSRVSFSTLSDWGNGTKSTQNTAVLRVDASETVGSLSGGNATRGSVNINGAAVTLTTGADNSPSTFSGSIVGTGGLTMSGSGTFTMDGAKSYGGDTKVLGGTLSTNSISLADAADVYLTSGSFFDLNFAGNDIIDSLFIDGVMQAGGTWGATGNGGATNHTALLTGTGILSITTGASAGVPGDYNSNGVVDGADYVVWRKGVNPLPNEVATIGSNTPEDYTAWRARFGNTSGSGSGLGAAAVPEPATFALAAFGLVLGLTAGRRR